MIPSPVNDLESLQKYYSSPLPGLLSCWCFNVTNQPAGRQESMAQPTVMYGRKHQKGTNLITATAMIAFHIGAIAALFFITKGALLAALILYFVGGMLGIGMSYHRL